MRAQWRAARLACDHPQRTRTLIPSRRSTTGWAAQFDCPDCGFANYGDVASRFDISLREGLPATCRHCGRLVEWRADEPHSRFGFWYDVEHWTECCGALADGYHEAD